MPEPAVRPPYDSSDGLARRGDLLADRYRLYEQVGVGGMSVVRRGHDIVLDRPVAVKIARVDDPTFRRCLREEARAFGRLNHPRIAQIHDFGETADGRCYIVMELVTGESLADRTTAGPLDPPAAIRIAREVAEALAAVHAVGLVHRDVKPDNVIVTDAGAKLVDFGISAPVGDPDGDPDGRLLGTAAYVAPERIADAPVGPACDVYSLGVLLFGMLTGTTPFRGRSSTEVLGAHLAGVPEPLPAIAGLPAGIAEVCAACLARDPRQRPTAADVAAALTAALADRTPPLRSRRRRRLVLTAAGATLALAAAGWATRLDREAGTAAAGTPSTGCQVTFAVVRDTGSQFSATLAVTNLGPATGDGWRLDLVLPARQRLTGAVTSGGNPVTVTQAADLATLYANAAESLATGATAHLAIQADYHGTNLLPTDFRLNGRPCRAGLTGTVNTPTPSPTPDPTGGPGPSTAPGSGATLPATTTVVPDPVTTGPVGPTAGTPTASPSTAPSQPATPSPPQPKPSHSKKPKPTPGGG